VILIGLQARMGSTRLPGKPLLNVLGRPILSYLLERLNLVQGATVVLLTTTAARDQPLVDLATSMQVEVFRGSEENVLDRYTLAARYYGATTIVRITADCPLLDPCLIQQLLDSFHNPLIAYDYLSNTLQRTYPRGMDIEVFSREALEVSYAHASVPAELEHVTPYIYSNPQRFNLGNLACAENLSHWRWTIDTHADFKAVAPLLASLYPANPHFTFQDIVAAATTHPEWMAFNANVEQKPLHL
jgi:spore coat polysaccharide biosynthesis protein SpsF